MPIDTLRQAIHIRRKKNTQVFHNIARLWQIGQQATSHQHILNELYPWGDSIVLQFDNGLTKLLILVGSISFFSMFFLFNHGLGFIITLCLMLCAFILAFMLYEPNDSIEEVIRYLEEKSIETRYDLKYGTLPEHLPLATNPSLLINQLKYTFPFFNKGSNFNTIPWYASAKIYNTSGTAFTDFVFQYTYINEVQIKDRNGHKITSSRVEKSLWGIFVFKTPVHGLAATNLKQEIGFPYTARWQSSDIQINQHLQIYGLNQLQLVKSLQPALLLRLADFLKRRQGEIIFHEHQDMMCFLGEANLFEPTSKAKTIHDISSLRGHLRTFRLKHYEQLCHDLKVFLQEE